MWNRTAFTDRLGIRYPIVQGPFGGGASSAALVAAVSNGGGLGCFGANTLSAEQIAEVAADIRSRTDKPFAFNLWVNPAEEQRVCSADLARALEWMAPYCRELGIEPPAPPERFTQDYQAQVEAVLAAKPSAFSFVFGLPAPELVRECTKRHIATIGIATTVDEAAALEERGVSAIVATGFEAGGHRASFLRPAEESFTGTLAPVPQVVDAVRVPVIAAGGVADGRTVAAAFMLGASAVQLGTAFLHCEEANVLPAHRTALAEADESCTVVTDMISGRPARYIRNKLLDGLVASGLKPLPIPAQLSLTLPLGQTGDRELTPLFAGQSASLVRHRKAADLVAGLASDALGRLRTFA